MLAAIISKISRIRTHLTRLDQQPLGKAALTIVLLLDIFILSSIFDGLDKHTAQLTQPYEHIPADCREIVLDERWNASNRLERLSVAAALEHNQQYYSSIAKNPARHPVCETLISTLETIKKDKELGQTFNNIQKIKRESGDLRAQAERLKGSYDTSLLESIARQGEGQANVDALRNDLRAKTEALNTLTQKMTDLQASVVRDKRVQAFWALIDHQSAADREALRSDLQKLNFWYPVKRLGMEMIFLLPLFGLFYLWNFVSLRKDRPLQTLVSSHLLVVTVVPVLFKVIQLIYNILPKKFLQNLVALLESMKLVALWHYLAMALAIAATLVAIYVVQKTIFSRGKLLAKRIANDLCQECGSRLPPASSACPLCGFGQFKPCRHCGKPTHVYGSYCKECGEPAP
ncbi:MAG: zinc ribbon domain-containing protein [Sulfuricellaceae bacterium]|nr:zinc ribbon domain-containing protein [Sulfuricellaceae bacterium]